MNQKAKDILKEVANISDIPEAGAYNIRVNGKSVGHASVDGVDIVLKEDGSGMDIHVGPYTKNDFVLIPVVIDKGGHEEVVYNDFYIGEGADVTIVAGCGIHNVEHARSKHDGIHSFYIEKGAKVKYIEKHYGSGDDASERVLNPVTNVYMKQDSYMEMDTVQIGGVDETKRVTNAELSDGATLVVGEKLMTDKNQYAETAFNIVLNGEKSAAHVRGFFEFNVFDKI